VYLEHAGAMLDACLPAVVSCVPSRPYMTAWNLRQRLLPSPGHTCRMPVLYAAHLAYAAMRNVYVWFDLTYCTLSCCLLLIFYCLMYLVCLPAIILLHYCCTDFGGDAGWWCLLVGGPSHAYTYAVLEVVLW
jgi:hypothetical protein